MTNACTNINRRILGRHTFSSQIKVSKAEENYDREEKTYDRTGEA